MAVAGRVAIVPKGEYVRGGIYKRLDLVSYNNKVFIAKKDNSSVPAEGAEWMFVGEFDKQKLDTTASKLEEFVNKVNNLNAQSVGALPSNTKYAASESVGGAAKALAYKHVINTVISGSDYIVYFSDGSQVSYTLPKEDFSIYAIGNVTGINSNSETYVYIQLTDILLLDKTYLIMVDNTESRSDLFRGIACSPDYFVITDSNGSVKTIRALNKMGKSYYYNMTYTNAGITISKRGNG